MNYYTAHMNMAADFDWRQMTLAKMVRGRGFTSAKQLAAPFAVATQAVCRDLLVLRS